MRSSPGSSFDAAHAPCSDLSGTQHPLDRQHMLACVRGGKKHPQHKIWPYLLRNVVIDRPNQVWCADISYIPMRRGLLYLVAIMDWYSRKVLAWQLSNSMDVDFCIEALKEVLAKHGKSEIFNSPSRGHAAHNPAGQKIRAANLPVARGSTC